MTDRDRLKELLKQAQDKYFELRFEYARDSEGKTIESFEDFCADHLLANGVVVLDMNVLSTKNRPLITHFAGMPLNDVFDLVRAKEEGRLIVPPCKVGDMVYEIQPIRQRVQSYEITTLKWNGHYWWFTWILKDCKGIYGNVEGFSSHQFGKTVFLTKEEAEAKLKECEG